MKILIIVPNLYLDGGVTNYFHTITKYLSVEVDFFEVGAVKVQENSFEKIKHLVCDWIRFRKLIRSNRKKYNLIHFNPSFGYASLIRDGILLRLAKQYNQNTIVFFHGWNKTFTKILGKYFFQAFYSTFNKTNAFIVLASEFKKQLRDWGFKQNIYIETTAVEDALIENFSAVDRFEKKQSKKIKQILFLSRIEKEKGICETIDAFKKLLKTHWNLSLVIAGDGSFAKDARELVKRNEITNNVSFLGYVRDEAKKQVFLTSDVYVFPTYGEGMPISVLEAMAFGLPIVTRSVGGMKDFFIDGKHGFITESKKSSVIATLIERIILDDQLLKEMSIAAHKYAVDNFLASKVAKKLENIYQLVAALST